MKEDAPILCGDKESMRLAPLYDNSSDDSDDSDDSVDSDYKDRPRRMAPKVKLYHFSAQVLACCQQLYREGIHVLYKESQAKLICSTLEIRFLNIKVYARNMSVALSEGAGPDDGDLFWIGKANMRGRERRATPFGCAYTDESTGARTMNQVYPAIAAFDKLIVDVVVKRRDQGFKCFKAVQYLLKDKEVTLSNRCGIREDARPVPNTWLNSCRLLRCKDVAFKSHTHADLERIRAIITGTVSVSDGSSTLREVQEIQKRLRGMKMSTTGMKREVKLLREAVLNCNSKLVVKYRKDFATAAEEATRQWKLDKMKALEKEKEEAENTEAVLLDTFAKLH